MKGKLANLFLAIIGVFLMVNLVRSISSISEKGKIIEDTQKRLIEAKEKNSQLKRKLAKIESPAFIEKEAREKLNLGREGEYMVILPPVTPSPPPQEPERLTNLEAWMKVFW
ncbi:septum formation initiator family protein [Candidatus Gottesmanbacteria bacterium]|nr:septum formation initiator family protein [Candidatus Gottesmanbacteria bacterium]